jgi:hypothetical protein
MDARRRTNDEKNGGAEMITMKKRQMLRRIKNPNLLIPKHPTNQAGKTGTAPLFFKLNTKNKD